MSLKLVLSIPLNDILAYRRVAAMPCAFARRFQSLEHVACFTSEYLLLLLFALAGK